jgi:uncharacterized protein YjdB
MIKTANRLCIVILSIFLLILTGCDGIIPDSIYVELNKPYSVLLIGETDQLEARIVHSNAPNQNVIWASGDPGIATVSRTGLVTGVAAGKTFIAAALAPGDRTTTCEVTVAPMTHAAGVEIVPSTEVSISRSQTFQYLAIILPSNTINTKVVWSSSNSSVATISENGLVTAVTDGWTIIKATSVDGGFSATVWLDVISTEVPVTGILIDGDIATFGLTPYQAYYEILPATATNKKVFWASSNPRIATVTQSGLITPLQYGLVNIFIMTEDGGYTNKMGYAIIEPPTFDPLMTQVR